MQTFTLLLTAAPVRSITMIEHSFIQFGFKIAEDTMKSSPSSFWRANNIQLLSNISAGFFHAVE